MIGWVTIIGAMIAGALPGLLLAGPVGGLIGAIAGAVMGIGADRASMRPIVAIFVIAGAITGAFVGAAIARVLCLPATCLWLEIVAGLLTGAGALIGVGMIAALTARSFDEYRETTAANRPPPTTGCSRDEDCVE